MYERESFDIFRGKPIQKLENELNNSEELLHNCAKIIYFCHNFEIQNIFEI